MTKLYVHVRQTVNSGCIRKETRGGDEFIIIRSATLPDNVVMNGGLYPAEEIEKSYKSLDGKLAPLGHPRNANGDYISANDRWSIDHYDIGGVNENPVRENGRVWLDKAINVRVASQSDRGKRLLDRIAGLISGKGEPIHTSTGIWLNRKPCEPSTNDSGDKYSWIAEDMVFDHDAILLDDPGAATPDQGVGMGVNSCGDSADVMLINAKPEGPQNKLVQDENFFNRLAEFFSFSKPGFQPNKNQGDPMKDKMIKALKEANAYKEGMNDEEVFNAYSDMLKKGKADDKTDDKKTDEDKKDPEKKPATNSQEADLLKAVQDAVSPLVSRLEKIEANQAKTEEAEKSGLVSKVVSANLLDEESAKTMSVNQLQALVKNIKAPAMRVGGGYQANAGEKDDFEGYDLNGMMGESK